MFRVPVMPAVPEQEPEPVPARAGLLHPIARRLRLLRRIDAGGAALVRAVVAGLMVLLTVLALIEADVDRPVASVAWLALGPLVASLLLTTRWTALVASYALLLGVLVVATRPGTALTGAVQLLVLAGLGAFAAGNCWLRERRQEQLRAVLRVAQVAQAAILQPVPARSARLRFGSGYRSAERRAQVGGDVIDVQLTTRGARAMVGDVRGRGLAAVPLAAIILASFREACSRPGVSLIEVARVVDQAVELLGPDDQSATIVFLELDDRGWAEIVNCGHPPPLRRAAGGRVSSLSPAEHATPLGRSPRLRSDTYTLTPGDRLVVYTDGLLEASTGGSALPLSHQVRELAVASSSAAAGKLLAAAVRGSADDLRDDVAVLVIDVDPADPGPAAAAPAVTDPAAIATAGQEGSAWR